MGLPIQQSTWEFPNAISTAFDAATYAEHLPDLTGISDDLLDAFLMQTNNETHNALTR